MTDREKIHNLCKEKKELTMALHDERARIKKLFEILEDRIAQEHIEADDQLHEMYKREEELLAQIEAMKNCENCDRINCWQCTRRDKWNLGENK